MLVIRVQLFFFWGGGGGVIYFSIHSIFNYAYLVKNNVCFDS